MELGPPKHLAPQKLLEDSRHLRQLKIAGEGARALLETIRAWAASENIRLMTGADMDACAPAGAAAADKSWVIAPRNESLAEAVAVLAALSLTRGRLTTAEGLRAIYVRPSDAELNQSDA